LRLTEHQKIRSRMTTLRTAARQTNFDSATCGAMQQSSGACRTRRHLRQISARMRLIVECFCGRKPRLHSRDRSQRITSERCASSSYYRQRKPRHVMENRKGDPEGNARADFMHSCALFVRVRALCFVASHDEVSTDARHWCARRLMAAPRCCFRPQGRHVCPNAVTAIGGADRTDEVRACIRVVY
jgi:hypothetical protein